MLLTVIAPFRQVPAFFKCWVTKHYMFLVHNSHVDVHITRKLWSSKFCGSYVPLDVEISWKFYQSQSLSSQLLKLQMYQMELNKTWYVCSTPYVDVYITRKLWSSIFYGSCGPLVLEICPSQTFSLQLLWNCWTEVNNTWYLCNTSYVYVYITRKFMILHILWELWPYVLRNLLKSVCYKVCHSNTSETTKWNLTKLGM